MSNHTPAPWEDRGAAHSNFHHYIADTVNPQIGICEVFAKDGEWTERCEANARLICAAPELREACEEAGKFLLRLQFGDDFGTLEKAWREAWEPIEKIRAALRKAEVQL